MESSHGWNVIVGMKILEALQKTKWDFAWDNDRGGFYVTKNGEEVPDSFHKAVSYFDRSGAQTNARKQANALRSAEITAEFKEREHHLEFDRPLTNLEQEWVELDKKLVRAVKKQDTMTDDELARYSKLGDIVRKSLINHEHPAMAHRPKL